MFETKVREIIAAHVGKSVEELHDDDDIVDDLGASSLDVVEMVVDIEDTFGIKVEDARIIECRHVGEVVAAVARME